MSKHTDSSKVLVKKLTLLMMVMLLLTGCNDPASVNVAQVPPTATISQPVATATKPQPTSTPIPLPTATVGPLLTSLPSNVALGPRAARKSSDRYTASADTLWMIGYGNSTLNLEQTTGKGSRIGYFVPQYVAGSDKDGYLFVTRSSLSYVNDHSIWMVGEIGTKEEGNPCSCADYKPAKRTIWLSRFDGVTMTQNLAANPLSYGAGLGEVNGSLTAVVALSDDDVWAVGSRRDGEQNTPLIVHWDGRRLTKVAAPAGDYIPSALAMLNHDEGWVVGSGGTILHYTSGAWQRVASPTNADLTAIDMLSATNGWAVGANATALHWNGQEWSRSPVIYDEERKPYTKFEDVAVLGNDDAWLAGRCSHFVSSNTMGSASGGYLCNIGVLMHWNGQRWSEVDDKLAEGVYPSELYEQRITMYDANNGWAGGGSDLLRWDGKLWRYVWPTE